MYPVGINLLNGIAFPSKIVIKSPSPNPGITFKILLSNFTRSPSAFDNPLYCVDPSVYPTKLPVLLFTLLTLTFPVSSHFDICTSPTTRPANPPVANAVGSFFLASKTSPNVFPKSIFT